MGLPYSLEGGGGYDEGFELELIGRDNYEGWNVLVYLKLGAI